MAGLDIFLRLAGRGTQAVSRVLPTPKMRILQQLEQAAPAIFSKERAMGATFDPRAGRFLDVGIDRGQMMSPIKNISENLVRNPQELLSFAQRPEVMSQLQRGGYMGSWFDKDLGGLVVDPSRRFATRTGSLIQGLRSQQKAGFDLGRGEEFPVSLGELGRQASFLAPGAALGGVSGYAAGEETGVNPLLAGLAGAALGAAGGSAAARYARLAPISARRGAVTPDFLTGGLSGVTKATSGAGAARSLDDLLQSTRGAAGAGSTSPSEYANSIVKQLKSQIKTAKKTVKKKGEEVEVDVPELIFGAGGAKYPDELKQLGLQPIQGYNYAMSKTSDILKLDEPTVLAVLKSNIRALSGRGGAQGFYTDVNKALRSSTGNALPGEQLGGAFAPFSMGTAVPQNAVQARRFLENPELFPGRMPGEGTQQAGNAWKQALRSATNENPLDPFNFNVGGKVIKVGSFAENVGLPITSKRATIDRHAVQAALGIRPTADDVIPDLQNEKVYRLFERAYKEVADEFGIQPNRLQSEVWDVWRRIMVKNPGASSPSSFILPANTSDIWKLNPSARKIKLRDILSKDGKDETFLGSAGLL